MVFNLGMFSKNFTSNKFAENSFQNDMRTSPKNATYLWTSFFNKTNNVSLIELLTQWNITTFFLSVNPTMDLTKLKSFQMLASEKGIKVDFLIGENSYAEEKNGFRDLEKVMIVGKKLGFKGIHLDIEPHTFDDYELNKSVYSQHQIELFVAAKKWCDANQLDLSVSVPMYLPIEVIKALGRNKITTHIMAYGSLSISQKMEQTTALRKFLKNNYRWAFEIEEFANKNSLIETENILIKKGITEFTYHDLSQLAEIKK